MRKKKKKKKKKKKGGFKRRRNTGNPYDNFKKNKKKKKKKNGGFVFNTGPKKYLFSIVDVIYPENFMDEYIRSKIDKASNEFINDCGEEKNATSYAIRKGRFSLTARVRLCELSGRFIKYCTIQSHGTPIPFAEPYFLYKCILEPSGNGKSYFDYTVKEILDITLMDLDFTENGKTCIEYILLLECNMNDDKISSSMNLLKRHLKKRKNPKNSTRLDISDFEILGKENYEALVANSVYFIFHNLQNVINIYKGIIKFDVRKLCFRFKKDMAKEIEDVITNAPWFTVLPSIQEKFCIKELDCFDLMKLDESYKKKYPSAEEFPKAYYWVLYILKAIESILKNTKNTFVTYVDVYDELFDVTKRDYRKKIGTNPVIESFIYSTKLYKIQDIENWASVTPEFNRAMMILIKRKLIVVTKRPKFRSKEEQEICSFVEQVFSSGSIGESGIFDALKKKSAEYYKDIIKNSVSDIDNDRIYLKEVWDAQDNLLITMKAVLMRNVGCRNSIEIPEKEEYIDQKHYLNLNEKQKQVFNMCVIRSPFVSCTGFPGAGKTEVIKSLCKVFDKDDLYICVGGVNGITSNVLRKRLNPSFITSSQIRLGESKSQKKKCVLTVMTLDMMIAMATHGIEDFMPVAENTEILIIDEFQNVDLMRMSRVVSIFPNLKNLWIFGDTDQINPICMGSIGKNIMNTLCIGTTVKLTENNRVKGNPDSMSIVKNFETIAEADYQDMNYDLIDDDEGTQFLSLNLQQAVKKIVKLYKESDDFKKIEIITPMKETVIKINHLVGEKIRKLVLKETRWKVRGTKQVPFPKKKYIIRKYGREYVLGNPRNILQVGSKIHFKKNYKAEMILYGKGINRRKNHLKLRKSIDYFISSAVFNGESAWINRIEKRGLGIKNRNRNDKYVYIFHLVMKDDIRKEVVVGPRHVNVNDIVEGYITTIDALLGGQNETVVFYLGDDNREDPWRNGKSAILRNLEWVGRDRIVSAMSRAEKRLIVIAPKVTLNKEEMTDLYIKRERNNGRIFMGSEEIKAQTYMLKTKSILKLMADLKPRTRMTDIERFLNGIHRVRIKEAFIDKMSDMINDDDEFGSDSDDQNVCDYYYVGGDGEEEEEEEGEDEQDIDGDYILDKEEDEDDFSSTSEDYVEIVEDEKRIEVKNVRGRKGENVIVIGRTTTNVIIIDS